MPRQRLALTNGLATGLGHKVMALPALVAIYCGAVVLAIAAGLAPEDVNSVTGFQTVYERLGALDPADWSQNVRIGVAAGGIIGLVVLLALGWAQRLIPHLSRSAHVLRDEDDGRTTVSPRAIERAVEIAAARHTGVRDAKATLGEDDVRVALHARRADLIPEMLTRTKTEAETALAQAGLAETTPVRVTITRFSPASKSELLK